MSKNLKFTLKTFLTSYKFFHQFLARWSLTPLFKDMIIQKALYVNFKFSFSRRLFNKIKIFRKTLILKFIIFFQKFFSKIFIIQDLSRKFYWKLQKRMKKIKELRSWAWKWLKFVLQFIMLIYVSLICQNQLLMES